MENIKELLEQQLEISGFCILKGLFDTSVVEEARDEVRNIVNTFAEKRLAQKKITDDYPNVPFETRLMRLYENDLNEAPSLFRKELHREGFFGMFFHPGLLDVVEYLLGSELLLYPNYSVRPKLSEFEAAGVLWHQDGGYTESGQNSGEVSQMRMVNLWTPLVPLKRENGCMQFIPGTHKLGVVPHLKKQFYLEIAGDVLDPRLKDAVDVVLDPGDAVLFHNLLFHQGLPNHADHIRWSLDWRYLDARQQTLRQEKGHLARSRTNPDKAVKDKVEWAGLSFG